MEFDFQQVNYQLDMLSRSVENLDRRVSDFENQMFSQSNNVISIVQSLNMQIQLLNQMNQNMTNFTNKVSDMEIILNNSDDFNKDIIESQNSISLEIQDLKQAIEGLRFYVLNQGTNY